MIKIVVFIFMFALGFYLATLNLFFAGVAIFFITLLLCWAWISGRSE